MTVSAKEWLKEPGTILPQVSRPSGSYISAAASGYLLFTAGQVPGVDDIMKYEGKVGRNSTLEDTYAGARICAVNCLMTIEQAVGSLGHVAQILKVNGYIDAAPGFTQNLKILGGASGLLLEMFGNARQHTRSTIGVQTLPDGAVVEVEMAVLLKGLYEHPTV